MEKLQYFTGISERDVWKKAQAFLRAEKREKIHLIIRQIDDYQLRHWGIYYTGLLTYREHE